MSKKLEGNGLWESSRMMLPQHKERIIEHHNQHKIKVKPMLHEDEWDTITQNISLSLNYNEVVIIEIFDEYENRSIEGRITSVSTIGKKLKVECLTGFEWVDFEELVSVRTGNGCVEQ
ncbi:YolD-like family protein [Paenibacillus lautus]|uniref:YolD-like family protein n=1 Tax=Paenibacillus lautus TaxID=1401 RepID=UPI001C7DF3BE|nr:YolD-like family protein [Paenibacillus lautus]MBX4152395.1 YolD-like family protein [Paenibacillus lautus]